MKKKLTKTTVDKAPTPTGADAWIWDTELEGFGLRIKASGRRIFVLRYRTRTGTQRKQNIGLANVLTPEQARDMARDVLVQVASGQDPMAQRRLPPSDATVEALFTAYATHLKARARASAPEVERALLKATNCAADSLGRTRLVSDVTAGDIVEHVAAIFKTGHRGAADKHRSYISSAFQWAIESANDYTVEGRRDWNLTRNPAADVPKDSAAIKPRDRNLTAAELKRLWQDTRPGAAGFQPETAACIRILIACGQRVQETLRMRGDELDLAAMTWRMPAEKTKGGKASHVVPIPAAVAGDLELLVAIHGGGPLFPARSGAAGDVIDHRSIMQALDRWMQRTSTPTFQTRDLRRTWKSRTHDAGIDRFTRDLIQQHARGDTGSKHYDRSDYLPQMRAAMAKWSDWIRDNLEDKPALQLVA
jgi:integrase